MDADLREYMNAIRNIKPTTPEEERELGGMLQAGRLAVKELAELEELARRGPVPADYSCRVREVKETIRSADRAKRQLVERYLRLAAYLAFRYKGRGVAMMDLIQDANMALMRAVDSWDYTGVPDNRFSAYATTAVTNTLVESVDGVSIIHFSQSTNQAIRKINRVSSVIQAVTGQEATPEMIAAEMVAPLDSINELYDMWQTARNVYYLDAPINEGEEEPLSCLLPDDKEDSDPDAIVTGTMLQEKVAAVLSTLEPSEEKVIRFRFGFMDGSPHSQEEVSHACGMTLQEEQLTEVKALRRLRHPSRSGQLVGLLG